MRSQWQFWDSGIDPKQIDDIIEVCKKFPEQEAKVATDTSVAKARIDNNIRVSTIRWVQDSEIFQLLWHYVQQANRNAFGFDVTSFASIQYTEYYGSNKGKYDWHEDVQWDIEAAYDRKLSVTVQLSSPDEYEGGMFEFGNGIEQPDGIKNKGSVLVFPSYIQHRVLPVTSGTRKSLVAWFEGPRWK